MPCIVPFDNSSLDISFFLFKPVGLFENDLIEALKYFSFYYEVHGCAYSSVIKSIHGNLVIWYGAWMKRSEEEKKQLTTNLILALSSLSSMARLVDYDFFEAYCGEAKDGHPFAKFSLSDTLAIAATYSVSSDLSNLSYAYLALLKSGLVKMEGASAGVCMRCSGNGKVVSLYVWKSLCSCYSWLINSNYRQTIRPYIDHLSLEISYDIFQVIYANNDDTLSLGFYSPPQMMPNTEGSRESKTTEDSEDFIQNL